MTQFKQEGSGSDHDPSKMEVKTFQPKKLNGEIAHAFQANRDRFGALISNELKSESKFNLHPASRRSLGIEDEEERNLEGKIVEEVERRVELIREEARKEGFAQGKLEGENSAITTFQEKAKPLFDRFQEILGEFDRAKEEIYHANEAFLIQLVLQVARQVTLKEIKTDSNYVKTLCAHLVERIGAKDHVKIKVGREDFQQVEAIRDFLKQQFADLKNIQIDVSDEFVNGGCKVETDLARINASVDTQLQLINQSLSES